MRRRSNANFSSRDWRAMQKQIYVAEDDALLKRAAIVSDFVAIKGLPILYAYRGRPTRPADSGWQFRSGRKGDPTTSGKVWMLKEVLTYESTRKQVLHMKVGTKLSRRKETDSWQVSRRFQQKNNKKAAQRN